jgi:diguanylate cyclase (GGDEF)-like protein
MNIKFEELTSEATTRFAQRSAELAGRGHVSPNNTYMLRHENVVWITTKRIESAIEAITRLLSSGHDLTYSTALSGELKALIESCATEIWCKQSIDTYGPLTNDERAQYERDLFQKRASNLGKANLEIDLLVDGLRSKEGKTQTQSKEIDQKFGILLSARQARLDFQEWVNELGPTSRSITVLFIDIDNFKAFNSRHTETVIDETILPDAMRLIHQMANQRGGAYKQGGEEFVLILPNHDRAEAAAFAEKLRLAFESTTFNVKDQVGLLPVW